MFEHHSENFGPIRYDKDDITTFNFEAIFELLQQPSISNEAISEIDSLTTRCFRRADEILDAFNVDMSQNLTMSIGPDIFVDGYSLQAWTDLFVETIVIVNSLDHVKEAQQRHATVDPSALKHSLMAAAVELATNAIPGRPATPPVYSSADFDFDRIVSTLLLHDQIGSNRQQQPVARSGLGALQGAQLIAWTARKASEDGVSFASSLVHEPRTVIDLTMDSNGEEDAIETNAIELAAGRIADGANDDDDALERLINRDLPSVFTAEDRNTYISSYHNHVVDDHQYDHTVAHPGSASPLSDQQLLWTSDESSSSATSASTANRRPAFMPQERERIWYRHGVPCEYCRFLGVECLPPDFDSRFVLCRRCDDDGIINPECNRKFWLQAGRVRKWAAAVHEGKSELEADWVAYGHNQDYFGVAKFDKITDYSAVMPNEASSSTLASMR
ncbi:hypothetical protein PSEUBRA_003014 [Kalmanozyma brasiliensis GHG001]|uniref:uncharacterized protein n=1 Tax=Kalmanozyma brasiliensis (strain GHG001) TaxID=1365824 RepID=UPI002867D1A2|nr:uncharacterized protein PSEUBRA_003014 [Kalmanozyma brasiliensis GHG001]KAF6767168.1 hypothetical protein PSEUBRA_003014 [Kalmanozyma brasiliensis GHG001]